MLGLAALTSLCYGYDAAMLRAIEGGALRAAVAAMRAHPQDEGLQLTGAQVLIDFGKGEANKHRVTEERADELSFPRQWKRSQK